MTWKVSGKTREIQERERTVIGFTVIKKDSDTSIYERHEEGTRIVHAVAIEQAAIVREANVIGQGPTSPG
jgi:hypothetical protein